MFAVALFPIIVNETPIFFIQGISLAVFLRFGLFIEVVLTQLTVISLMIRIGIGRKKPYKIPLNLLLFLASSMMGGFVYYGIGGINGVILLTNFPMHFEVVIYAITIFFSNQILLYFIRKYYLKHKNVVFFGRSFWWEVVTSLLIFPFGLVLYILYGEIGIMGIFYVGIPFVSISFIVKLYFTSQKMNYHLKQMSEFGHQLTARLKKEEVYDLFIESLHKMLPVDFIYIFGIHGNRLVLLRNIENVIEENNLEQPIKEMRINKGEGVLGRVWELNKSELYKRSTEWQGISSQHFTPDIESLLVAPINRNQLTTGVIAIGSKHKSAFEKYQLTIVDILATYLAVAVENANLYEQIKQESERCALTKLFNYRYFEKILAKTFMHLNEGTNLKHISLILLDIDHFKRINDTYGHQAGNEILCELATRLTTLINSRGIVARYGGEEFVVLLPGMNNEDAFEIAENIRCEIANKPFTIQQNADDGQNTMKINVMASIGVATAPNDSEDPISLVRNADRAMYIGAKQKGRNKVAVFKKIGNIKSETS